MDRAGSLSEAHRAVAADVRALVLDVDGVLTDGTLLYGPDGEVLQRFDVHDGYAIECLRSAGIEVAVLTGRVSDAVAARCRTLRIERVVQGSRDKASAIAELAGRMEVGLEEICYVGDDLFDIGAMRLVGLSAAPANARDEVKAEASCVCNASGGHGAVREVAEILLGARGAWPPPGVLPPADGS